MSDRAAESADGINAKTGRAIAEAIALRLRTEVPPEESKLPDRLRLLLDDLRAQDGKI
jgi:hypothetical protein